MSEIFLKLNHIQIVIGEYLPRCYICNPIFNSYSQQELINFCKQYYPNLIENDRELIKPLELDIVIPELKLAIEFNR